MKQKYRRLRAADRGVIYRMNKAGKSQCDIAEALGVSQGTISKELKRNKGKRGYRAKQSQEMSLIRQKKKRTRACVIVGDLEIEVRRRLGLKHSPEQISLALKRVGQRVSHETVYSYIAEDRKAGGSLYRELRINGKRRYRRRAGTRRSKIPNRKGLDQRPGIVDERKRFGDWEVDLIAGSQGTGFILSLYERKSRTGLISKLESKTSESTACAIIKRLRSYRVKTLTYDNGLEFAGHELVSRELEAAGYFCAPYASWEKGGVENYNGLVRQYYPKGSSFSGLTDEDLKLVEIEINERPRKTLDGLSPSELNSKIAA